MWILCKTFDTGFTLVYFAYALYYANFALWCNIGISVKRKWIFSTLLPLCGVGCILYLIDSSCCFQRSVTRAATVPEYRGAVWLISRGVMCMYKCTISLKTVCACRICVACWCWRRGGGQPVRELIALFPWRRHWPARVYTYQHGTITVNSIII